MCPRSALLTLALVVSSSATAQAAAPPRGSGEDEDEDEDACQETSLDEAKLISGRALARQGNTRYEAGDYLGAIEVWSQVMVLMPERHDLRVTLGHSHREAYEVDADVEHLRSAHELFTTVLEGSNVSGEQRESLEGEIATIEAELEALAEAQAQAQAERDEGIRQEEHRLTELALAEAEAEHQRNIQKIYYGVGGTMAGLGAGGLAAMGAFLGLGADLDSQGQATAMSTDVQQSEYSDLLADGQSFNRGAITAGIIGGVLFASGASLLIVAATRHARVIKFEKDHVPKAALSPGLGSMQLHF